ncbi:hypothetical protein [Stutzerimonas zhaodongensis]|uniref:hypothetical protein n=1 Tax=Stutzerimonas TaxID=2901164 RepID=UPI00388E0695
MKSLSLGVWGSFSTPRSRALGGKSGMTRAAPLVLFVLARRADLKLPHLLALASLALYLAWVSMPPPDRSLMTFIQEQTCPEDPTRIDSPCCALAEHSHTCRGTRRVSVRSQRAPPR